MRGLPCDARALGPVPKLAPAGLRQRDRTAPEGTALLGVPYGSQGHKRRERHGLSFLRLSLSLLLSLLLLLILLLILPLIFGAPATPPRRAGEAGVVRSRCLSPVRGEFRDRPACPSSRGHPEGAASGVCFLCLLFFAQAKKVSRPPQGGETTQPKNSDYASAATTR